MTAVMEAPPVERRCRIEEVFTASFIELLKLAPRNPLVRGLVLAFTRQMPPEGCRTYEELETWVEANCDKKQKRRGGSSDGIQVIVRFEDTECGRASYSVSRYATEPFRFDASELEEAAQQAVEDGDKLEELVTTLAGQIEDDAWNRCDPAMDEYGDYDYTSHDESDTEGSKIEFSRPELRRFLSAYLQEHHPDLWEALT